MKQLRISKALTMTMIVLAAAVFGGCARRLPAMDMQPAEILDTGYIGITVTEPQIRDMNATVYSSAQTNSARTVAGILETGIRESLTEQGFKQAFDEADILVGMDVTASRYDSFGEFHIYDASAETNIFRAPDMNSVASRRFSARSERKLGHGAALSDAGARLLGSIRNWLSEVLTPERLRVVTSDVTVILPERFHYAPSEYAVMMAGMIADIPGVYACRVPTVAERTVVFQVDYNQDAFPEGFDTYLDAVRQPEITLLHRSNVIITVPKGYKLSQGDYARLFIDTLVMIAGIHECRVIDRDPDARSTRFELIYEPDAFPEGLYYRLTGIESLDLAQD